MKIIESGVSMIEIIPNWHPVFVHFTVALLSIAVILFIVVRFVSDEKMRRQWEIVAQWNLWLGAIITVLTVAMGVVAYNSVAHDTPSHAAMTEHRNLALVTTVLFLCLAVWSALRARAGQGINTVILLGLLVAGGLLMSTAWHGGEVVYRYGLGVMSLPKTDNHGHASGKHEHAGAEDGHASLSSESDPASMGDHHDEIHKDDVENCELPEAEETSVNAPDNASDNASSGHAHDGADAHPHTGTKPVESDAHHDDGHSDHKH